MSRDWSPPQQWPFSVGVVLAANAVADAFLLMDAPGCALWRPGFAQGGHDWASRLWRSDGFHRVLTTGVSTEDLAVGSPLPELSRRLEAMAARPDCGVVMAAAFPLVTVAGVHHPTAWRALDPAPRQPFVNVVSPALNADWLDGYAAALDAMAAAHPLAPAASRADAVAIVGYLHDRNERDHAANRAELQRLLGGLDLDLVSVWLDGSPFQELGRVASAGTIVSMPHARDAARTLSRRLGGVPVADAGIPFGLKGTADWLRAVAAATGRSDRVEALIDRELGRVVPRVAWAMEALVDGRVAFLGDPHWLRPLAVLLSELGVRLAGAAALAGSHHEAPLGPWDDLPCAVRFAPTTRFLGEAAKVPGTFAGGDVDCGIGGFEPPWRTVALGFPAPYQHALADRPFLGFEGCLHFVGRLGDEIAFARAIRGYQR